MIIPHPDFFASHTGSWIPDPTTMIKSRRGNFCCLTFFVAINFTKLKIIFKMGTEKNLNQLAKN